MWENFLELEVLIIFKKKKFNKDNASETVNYNVV